MLRLIAFAVLLAVPSRAGVLSFDAGPADGVIYSGDGYHVARLVSDGREDFWTVDGQVRARARAGTLPPSGVLSTDGSKLLHLVTAFDSQGRPAGYAAAVNGRRVGKSYAEVGALTLSPSGRNIGYIARAPQGIVVVSGQGTGPAFPDSPGVLTLTDTGTLYFADKNGEAWLYVNHKPVRNAGSDQLSASADLRHVGAVLRDEAAGSVFVDVDGTRYGPYASATVPVFSRNSAHWAFMAASPGNTEGGYNLLMADKRPAAGMMCSDCSLVVDDAGRAFQDVLIMSAGERAQMHSFYLNGKELRSGGRPPKIGLLAGGGHFVYPMLTPRGVAVGLDGRDLEYDVPLPLPDAPVEFDGPLEYHYWTLEGSSLRLNCGTLDGSDPKLTRCAQKTARVFAVAQ